MRFDQVEARLPVVRRADRGLALQASGFLRPYHTYIAKRMYRHLRQELDALKPEVHRQSIEQLLYRLSDHFAIVARLPPVREMELVSVVMPVWNRAAIVGRAIESVLAQSYRLWELIVVDDGSDDGTAMTVSRYLGDQRIRLVRTQTRGVSAARNAALAACRGGIVAYLDSDNTWFPSYLREVVRTLASDRRLKSVYLPQIVVKSEFDATVRDDPFDRGALVRSNYIDLNVFAHRRKLFKRYGGFDVAMTRLVDWDIVLRYTVDWPAVRIPTVGGVYYHSAAPNRISKCELFGPNYYRVRRKWSAPIDRPLKVLYALWHYPQLSESYVRWEIDCLRRWGVEIEIWSKISEPPPAPFETDVRVHHGALKDAIAASRPDLIHSHWCSLAASLCAEVAALGLPMTVRDHAFDTRDEIVQHLQQSPAVGAIFMFPELARRMKSKARIYSVPAAFNGDLYYPSIAKKDRRLVLRVGAAIPKTKDLEAFVRMATRCRSHRFVMAAVICQRVEQYADTLREKNAELGNPVDLRFNVPAGEVAALTREAGIYLHTKSPSVNFGMPISISESMATGCYVLARKCEASAEYLGEAGRLYSDEDDAVRLVTETIDWDDQSWESAGRAAVERAYSNYADVQVYRTILDTWLALVQREPALVHAAAEK